jgi:hypothetical protein
MGWYEVKLYFTGYRAFEIEADSEEEAHTMALTENEALTDEERAEILAALERWPEADDIESQDKVEDVVWPFNIGICVIFPAERFTPYNMRTAILSLPWGLSLRKSGKALTPRTTTMFTTALMLSGAPFSNGLRFKYKQVNMYYGLWVSVWLQ